MARSLPENGDAVRMPLLWFPGPGAGKGMASCHAFSAVHAAIRVSRMAVRHAAWTDNGPGILLAISVLADFRRRSSGRMMTGGTRAAGACVGTGGKQAAPSAESSPGNGAASHPGPDSRGGTAASCLCA